MRDQEAPLARTLRWSARDPSRSTSYQPFATQVQAPVTSLRLHIWFGPQHVATPLLQMQGVGVPPEQLTTWPAIVAGSMPGTVLPREARRVGQETLPRTTAGACTGSFISSLLPNGPVEKRCPDGLFALTIAAGFLCNTRPRRCAALARSVRAIVHLHVVAALRVGAVIRTDVDVASVTPTDLNVLSRVVT